MSGIVDQLVSDSATNPLAAAAIVTTASLPAGRYEVLAATACTGTVAAGDLNNVQLQVGETVIGTLLQAPVANTLWPNQKVTVSVPVGGAAISVNAIANASGALVTYNAQLVAHQIAAY